MKNATTRTPAGGRQGDVDNNADLPAHSGACHHTYRPLLGSVQYAASSCNSASRNDGLAFEHRQTFGNAVTRLNVMCIVTYVASDACAAA